MSVRDIRWRCEPTSTLSGNNRLCYCQLSLSKPVLICCLIRCVTIPIPERQDNSQATRENLLEQTQTGWRTAWALPVWGLCGVIVVVVLVRIINRATSNQVWLCCNWKCQLWWWLFQPSVNNCQWEDKSFVCVTVAESDEQQQREREMNHRSLHSTTSQTEDQRKSEEREIKQQANSYKHTTLSCHIVSSMSHSECVNTTNTDDHQHTHTHTWVDNLAALVKFTFWPRKLTTHTHTLAGTSKWTVWHVWEARWPPANGVCLCVEKERVRVR